MFKTGSLGLGYYKDGAPEQTAINLHKLLWPTQGLAPVVICLDEVVSHRKVIGDPINATTEDQVAKKVQRVDKTRKQWKNGSRAAKAREAVELLVEVNTVKLADTSHREKGWWAIDIANPNAWGGAAEILASSSADAIAIQETRVVDEATKDHENIARNAGWNMAVSGCGVGGGR